MSLNLGEPLLQFLLKCTAIVGIYTQPRNGSRYHRCLDALVKATDTCRRASVSLGGCALLVTRLPYCTFSPSCPIHSSPHSLQRQIVGEDTGTCSSVSRASSSTSTFVSTLFRAKENMSIHAVKQLTKMLPPTPYIWSTPFTKLIRQASSN